MTSGDRLRGAMNPDDSHPMLSSEAVRASLGEVGLSPADRVMAELNNLDIAPPLSNALDIINNPETQKSFERAFDLSKRLVSYAGLSAPTPEQMMSVGVKFQYLAKQFGLIQQKEGVPPHIVLAPHGLGMQNWMRIAKEMTADKTIPKNPLRSCEDYYGLQTSLELTESVWRDLDKVSTHTTTPGLTTLPVYTDSGNGINLSWTIRLISGSEKPSHLHMSYEQTQQQIPPLQHQTLAESLTDKFTTLFDNTMPTDAAYWLWCWQPNSDSDYAPVIQWDISSHQIKVYRQIIDAGFYTGSRSPVG